jgi:hypothetical protein
MLTRRIFELVLVASSAAYLTTMVFVFSSSEQPCQDTNKQSYRDRAYETDKDEQWESIRHWMMHDAAGFFTFLLVNVGGLQLVMFFFQLRLIGKSIDLARDEFNATHRPHLIVRDVCMDGNNIAYLLVNKGDAPAVIVESWIMAESIQFGGVMRPLRSSGHNELGQLSFAVGQIRDLTYIIPGDPSVFIHFHDAKRKDRPEIFGDFHFTGTIIYTDSRGQQRRSVFRRRWDDIRKGFYRVDDPDQEYSD